MTFGQGVVVGLCLTPVLMRLWVDARKGLTMLWESFYEYCLQRDEPPASPKVDADELVVRAMLQDMDLEGRYPWLTAEQRRDILQRRRQETR